MSYRRLPRQRLVLYILCAAFIPHFFLLNHFLNQKGALEESALQAESLERAYYRQESRQALNRALRKTYEGPLVRQREELIEKSLHVKFIEGKMEKGALFQEIPVQFAEPLKLNTTELKELLSLLEDKTIPPFEQKRRPAFCLITDIRLERVESEDKEQFLVNLKMVKREFP